MRGTPGTLYQVPPRLYRVPLPNDHHLAFNPAGSAGVVVLNEPAARVLDGFATPAPLADPTAHQLAALGLLMPLCVTEYATRDTRHTLTLWLHITTRCNLRCAYCYAPRGNTDMPPEVGRAAVDAALRSAQAHGFAAVKLKYAGGEPTLNPSTVRAVHVYARERTAEAGLELREVLLTNGTTLTPAVLKWLGGEGIRLSISLDGVGLAHDRQRATADGNGSFASAAAAVDRALALGLFPHLSVTVTARNVGGLAEVVAFALERRLPFNLNFVRPVPGAPDLSPAPGQLIAGLQTALAEVERRLPPYRLIDGLLDRCDLSGAHRYPCGAGHSYMVVGPRGGVACCHMEMERTVGSIWDGDPLEAVREARDDFRNSPVDEKEDCRDCRWRYVCAGGCPLLARWQAGRDGAPSPYCEVYRAVLPELVRLEGLRLLKRSVSSA